MLFFSGLILFFGLFWSIAKVFNLEELQSYYTIGTHAAAVMFILVGIMHFAKREKLEAMIPTGLKQYARLLNYGSGALEIILGLLLMITKFKELAAWSLIILLILIFPANIFVAQKKPDLYNVSRLFFQPVYIAWLWFFCL